MSQLSMKDKNTISTDHLRVNGHVIGAVGCSGASSEEDHECAIAGASKAGLFHSKI
ncbi:heme-binding protein [Nodularia spumigena]|uniref:heme-binding protein n=1 Tax=Nodularia spumigena TaxID=70799 RepID=UPI0009EE9DCB